MHNIHSWGQSQHLHCVFFSCDVAVNVCPFKFIRFFIVQYHEPPLSFCWFRLAFTHCNGYNASTKICESRVNNLHYIHTSQRLRHSQFVGNHLLIIGLVFSDDPNDWHQPWFSQKETIPGLEILATKVTKEAAELWKIHQEWESREVFFKGC